MSEHQVPEESSVQHHSKLTSSNDHLANQVSEQQQTVNQFTQQLEDRKTALSEANKKLQEQIYELTSINKQLETQAAEHQKLDEMMGNYAKGLGKSMLPAQVLDEDELRSLADMAKRRS